LLFRIERRIVDGKAGKRIATSAEKVISKKRKAGTIGQSDDTEIGMQFDV
jgi:hypothetical protein